MSAKIYSFLLVLVLVSAVPASAKSKKKGQQRAMLEKMYAVPCGASQKGLSGLGSLWASVGITHMTSNEKLCPQYLIRTDQMEYEIRPMNLKHAALLPIGHEAVIKIQKNHMMLRVADSHDHKMRSYQVVGMSPNPANADNSEGSSSDDADQ
jgi:hypothetical protein